MTLTRRFGLGTAREVRTKSRPELKQNETAIRQGGRRLSRNRWRNKLTEFFPLQLLNLRQSDYTAEGKHESREQVPLLMHISWNIGIGGGPLLGLVGIGSNVDTLAVLRGSKTEKKKIEMCSAEAQYSFA
ncbi:hypothetical protein C8J57DRAFT_1221029 [Mycena rebaudengoi]|nr:hypothetical protein C8J57DRAFT_1221029 [Mycena rebaudengoi]